MAKNPVQPELISIRNQIRDILSKGVATPNADLLRRIKELIEHAKKTNPEVGKYFREQSRTPISTLAVATNRGPAVKQVNFGPHPVHLPVNLGTAWDGYIAASPHLTQCIKASPRLLGLLQHAHRQGWQLEIGKAGGGHGIAPNRGMVILDGHLFKTKPPPVAMSPEILMAFPHELEHSKGVFKLLAEPHPTESESSYRLRMMLGLARHEGECIQTEFEVGDEIFAAIGYDIGYPHYKDRKEHIAIHQEFVHKRIAEAQAAERHGIQTMAAPPGDDPSTTYIQRYGEVIDKLVQIHKANGLLQTP